MQEILWPWCSSNKSFLLFAVKEFLPNGTVTVRSFLKQSSLIMIESQLGRLNWRQSTSNMWFASMLRVILLMCITQSVEPKLARSQKQANSRLSLTYLFKRTLLSIFRTNTPKLLICLPIRQELSRERLGSQ